MNLESKPVITEDEKQLLADIEATIKSLVDKGWRVATYKISESRSMRDEDTSRSLELRLYKGPLTLSGY